MTTQSTIPPTAAGAKNSWFVERHSIDPIPEDQRGGKLYTSAAVWIAMNATPQTIAAGGVGIALGLPLWACALGIVLGSLIGGFLTALHAEQGPRLGLGQMIQSRAQFGFFGNLLPGLAAVITYYVYTTFIAVLSYQGLTGLFGWPPELALFVGLGLPCILAIIGYKGIHFMNTIITVICVVVTVLVFFMLVPSIPTITYTGEFSGAAFLTLLIFHIVGQLANATFISDYTRYLPKDTKASHMYLAVMGGGTGSGILVTLVGMVAASLNFDALNSNTIGYMGSMFPGSFGFLVTLLLTFSSVFIGVMSLYSGYQSTMMMITSRGGKVSAIATRALICSVFAIAAGFTAIAVSEDFINNISGLVNTLAYILIPWTAINITDFYLVSKGRFDPEAIADRNGMYGLFNVRAMTIYLLGVLIQIPFIVSDFPPFVGPIAAALGGLNFAWAVGFGFCVVAYWLVTRNDPAKQELIARGASAQSAGHAE